MEKGETSAGVVIFSPFVFLCLDVFELVSSTETFEGTYVCMYLAPLNQGGKHFKIYYLNN